MALSDMALLGSLVLLAFLVLAFALTRANDRAVTNYVHTGTTRPTSPAGRAELRERKRFDVAGELLPAVLADDEEAQIVPYAPQASPMIRVDTGRLPSAASGPGWELERRTPNRAPTVASDVAVPMLQATMTAVAFGVMAALMSWALAWSWRVPLVVLALALAVGWLWRLRVIDSLLWRIESVTRLDVTGDGQIGPPVSPHAFTLANPAAARAQAAQESQQAAEDAKRTELLAFVTRCYTVGTSEAAQAINPSGRAEYLEKRDTLMRLGLAGWKQPGRPRAGWELTVTPERAKELVARHVL